MSSPTVYLTFYEAPFRLLDSYLPEILPAARLLLDLRVLTTEATRITSRHIFFC